MTYIIREQVALAVDASGDRTTYTTNPVTGLISQIRYVPDGTSPLDTGADLAITGETTGVTILVASNIGTSAVEWLPRKGTNLNTNASANLFAAGGKPVVDKIAIVGERIKVIVAQGGTSKLGTLHIWVE